MAKNYGTDVVGSFRVPATTLAAAAAWLTSKGIQPSSRNDILVCALSVLADQLPDDQKPGTAERAFQLLDREWPVKSYKGSKRVLPKIEPKSTAIPPEEGYTLYCGTMNSLGLPALSYEEWLNSKQ